MGTRAWTMVLFLAGPGLLLAPAAGAQETDVERNQRLEEKLKRLEQRQKDEEAARKKAAHPPEPARPNPSVASKSRLVGGVRDRGNGVLEQPASGLQ